MGISVVMGEVQSVKMAESLRRLVDIGTFQVLQEKLERWLDGYKWNSCDQNVARGCEIIELNSKVQGQLFRLLNICAQEGGLYGGASTIKNRLLPFLGSSFFTSGTTADTSLGVIADAVSKNRELEDLTDQYEDELRSIEPDLRAKELENQDLRDELAETRDQVSRSTRTSTSDKLFLENENRELRRKLGDAQDELVRLRAKSNLVDDLERQIRSLKNELFITTSKASYLESDTLDSLTSYRYLPRTCSPLSEDDPVQRV